MPQLWPKAPASTVFICASKAEFLNEAVYVVIPAAVQVAVVAALVAALSLSSVPQTVQVRFAVTLPQSSAQV